MAVQRLVPGAISSFTRRPGVSETEPEQSHQVYNPTDTQDLTAFVWREMLQGIFSVLGRVARLANCRDPRTRRYVYDGLAEKLGPQQADHAMRVAHGMVWRDWISSPLEQQHSDVFLHLSGFFSGVERLVPLWIQSQPFLTYAPDSVSDAERHLFTHNLLLILELLRNHYCSERIKAQLDIHCGPSDVVEWAICLVREQFVDASLSLNRLSAEVGLSGRCLGRRFTDLTGMTFRQYLRDLRIEAAMRLLTYSNCELKAIAGMVGYSDRSHFGEDFRVLVGCTPLAFRTKKTGEKRSPSAESGRSGI